ncbi:mannitol dehydrogenase family protein [Cellulomonas sp. H30R-01]|nr:mannitol dehydrogenase family protein [Cellulomonas sp. H30R-01]
MRLVHLGLGAFARAHLLWFTEQANASVAPGERWGVAGFTGRSPRVAETLAGQRCVYTLVERGPDGDTADEIESLVEAHDGTRGARWRALLSRPEVGVLTLTVTEAGYCRDATGGLDAADPVVASDTRLLRRLVAGRGGTGTAATTAPGKVLDGLRARRAAGAGPIAVVSCDNLPHNGAVLRRVVLDLADAVDPGLAAWVREHVSFVSSMVDRITPATTEQDRRTVCALTGHLDRSPVVTEPFREWVLQGDFPAGRPAWEHGGARFVPDVEPYERRKLWLLNAGHSLLAYGGLRRGRTTVAEAFADPGLRAALEALWAEAREVLGLPDDEVDAALTALRARFANARIEHRLDQIARDGAQKVPVRILAVARARRDAGLPVGTAGAQVVADWLHHLLVTAHTTPDPADGYLVGRVLGSAPRDVVAHALRSLAPDLADDHALAAAVTASLDAGVLDAVR